MFIKLCRGDLWSPVSVVCQTLHIRTFWCIFTNHNVGGAVTYIMVASSTAAKSLRSLRIYVVLRDRKAVQVYASMFVLFDVWGLCAFWICSAPLSRLTPIEALPQAPLGALPPDPHNGFHPLTLTRGVPLDLLLASLGVGAQLWSALPIPNSSFLIPHSSLLTFYTCI